MRESPGRSAIQMGIGLTSWAPWTSELSAATVACTTGSSPKKTSALSFLTANIASFSVS
jgi:hypothetical protein